jgi:hypothetical protein
LSIALNIILTLSIATKIWIARFRIQKLLGVNSSASGQYVSVASMLVESAALYAVWSIVFLICYVRNTPLQNILLPPLGQIQGIAPVLIVFRVAQGRAWSRNTPVNVTAPSPAASGDRGRSGEESELVFNVSTGTRENRWSRNKASEV